MRFDISSIKDFKRIVSLIEDGDRIAFIAVDNNRENKKVIVVRLEHDKISYYYEEVR